jgi:hypothetical protein
MEVDIGSIKTKKRDTQRNRAFSLNLVRYFRNNLPCLLPLGVTTW